MSPALRAYLTVALTAVHGARVRVPYGYQIGYATHNAPIYVFPLASSVWIVDARQRSANGPRILRKFGEPLSLLELGTVLKEIAEQVQVARDRKVRVPVCRALVTKDHYCFPLALRIQLETASYIAGVKRGMI